MLDLDKVGDEARNAYTDGLNPEDNPHRVGSSEHTEWARVYAKMAADDPLAELCIPQSEGDLDDDDTF